MPLPFGPVPPKGVPQQDSQKVLMLAERWQRAAWAQERWATPAKKAYDFAEGRQWSEDELRKMVGRPALTFNIVAPIIRLVLGYHRNNRTDTMFSPGQDTLSSDTVADVLGKLVKQMAIACGQEYVDTEVFLDGITGGRGWFRTLLDFSRNDLGECITKAFDPFAVYPDPDADTYNLNESAAYMQTSKYTSIDEIEGTYGKAVAELVRPWTLGQTPLAPVTSMIVNDEVTPVRFFGQREDTDYWDNFYSMMGDFVDRHRKTIRLIETEYKVREPRNVLIDLETGDSQVCPEDWGPDKIQKAILYGEMVGNPLVVQKRMVERLHWTTMVGDLILYDAPSFYEGYTLTGYFPYFRRGVTRGMVEDLIDPQLEKNKRRSARIETEARTANGGWIHHESALDPTQERRLQKFGSRPGFTLKWKGEKEPKQIQPSHENMGQKRLEADADEDIRRISGQNEAALGQDDNRATSGRAILARQSQAATSVQMYMDNFKRSKHIDAIRKLDIIQHYYTEQRIYRIDGDDGKFEPIVINQVLQDPASVGKRILNDVTVGKYSVVIDDAPLSATFKAAQFDEMMALVEKLGPAIGPYLPMLAPLIVDMSTMPRKKEWIEKLELISGLLTQGAAGGAPPGGGPPGGQQAPVNGAPGQAPHLSPREQGVQGGGNVVPMPSRA